jgi:hypothetical protein
MKEKYSRLMFKKEFCEGIAKKLKKHPDSIRNIANGYVKSTKELKGIIEKELDGRLIEDERIRQMTVEFYERVKKI